MKPHDYLAMFVRLFAIALLIFTIYQFRYFLQLILHGHVDGFRVALADMFVTFFFPLCVSIFLWFFPVATAKGIIKPEMDQAIEPIGKQMVFCVIVAAMGLYLAFQAIVDAMYYLTLYFLLSAEGSDLYLNDLFDPRTIANIWATGLELCLGLLFVLKSKTIAKKILALAN